MKSFINKMISPVLSIVKFSTVQLKYFSSLGYLLAAFCLSEKKSQLHVNIEECNEDKYYHLSSSLPWSVGQ